MENTPEDSKQPLIDSTVPKKVAMSRSKTMGLRVQDKKTIFQWSADGKLQEVKVTVLPDEQKSESKPKSKFGSMQTTVIGGGPKSARSGFSTATTEVAFSNYDYPKQEGQEDGAIFMKVRGKPGILKKNLLIIPGLTLMLMFTGVDVMQTSV